MDSQTDSNEQIISVLNCEDKEYVQIIPKSGNPNVNNDLEDYVQYDNNVNILTTNEIPLNEAEEPPENNIYDGDSGKHNEHKVHENFTERLNRGSILTDKDQEQNNFLMWRLNIDAPNIYERVEETGIHSPVISTSNLPALPVRRREMKSKRKKMIVCMTVMIVMMAVTGLCFMVYYFTPSNTIKSSENTNATNDVTVIVPVTTNDVKCFNLRANCSNTSLLEKNIPENKIAREELIKATQIGNITQVCNLLKCGSSVNSHDEDGRTPLYLAVQNGNMVLTQLLLTYKASVDKANSEGFTPLDISAKQGDVNITQLLLTYNASVDTTDSKGYTPLYSASIYKHVKVVQILLEYNASVDKAASDGCTPLYMAAQNGQIDITQLLLTYNASVDKAESRGFTPLYISSDYGFANVVQLLLTYNASVDKANSEGRTPLYAASDSGRVNVVQILLTFKATVNKADKYGLTPLHAVMFWRTTMKDRSVIVEVLYNAGAHVNAQTTRVYIGIAAGSTALHIAVIRRNRILLKKLIFYKIKLLKNRKGLTALDISRKLKLRKITEELKKYAKLLRDRDQYSKFSQ